MDPRTISSWPTRHRSVTTFRLFSIEIPLPRVSVQGIGRDCFFRFDGLWVPGRTGMGSLEESPVFSPEVGCWILKMWPLWSPHESRYLCYYRSSVDGIRSIARASSTDFLDWKAEGKYVSVIRIRYAPAHLYTNQTQPYFRAPHIYVATPARFFPGRKVLSDEEARLIEVHPKYYNDTSDAALMTSRGGLLCQRFHLEALLRRPGIGANNWVSRSNYPVLGWVQTSPHEMSFYTNQDYGQPTAHLHRYVFRLDGLSSVRAGDHPGIWVSKPLVRSGNHLF